MKGIRPFCADDAAPVAKLYAAVFRKEEGSAPELLAQYRAYLSEVFLNNPWPQKSIQPLVHEDANGRITGFLGVVPRTLVLNGQSFQAAITSTFMVDPEAPGGIAGLKLLKAFLDGPQDISIADEARDVACKLWEGLGGHTSALHSIRWIRPLRPCQFGLWVLRKRRVVLPLCWAAAPAAWAADWIAGLLSGGTPQPGVVELQQETLAPEMLAAQLDEFQAVLRPEYSTEAIEWLFERAGRVGSPAGLRTALLRDAQGRIAGWYVYHVQPGAIAELLQFFAKPEFGVSVRDHLFDHARRNGALALAGQMEPALFPLLRGKHILWRPGPWVLIHSRYPEVIDCFRRGETFFSRLDGEWCCHF